MSSALVPHSPAVEEGVEVNIEANLLSLNSSTLDKRDPDDVTEECWKTGQDRLRLVPTKILSQMQCPGTSNNKAFGNPETLWKPMHKKVCKSIGLKTMGRTFFPKSAIIVAEFWTTVWPKLLTPCPPLTQHQKSFKTNRNGASLILGVRINVTVL